ncbi:AAA family ATPase [Hoylesella nanceiensis]|jgi:endonuclease|uniref:McrB family protein n=1 Tax=Hoylesella nanceiensis TaxID=425941 RepID=UPI0028D7053D|nr:AAA family ATPase [Hoylesella nanceiensis]
MDTLKLYKVAVENGEYSCNEVEISVDEWLNLLQDERAERYIETLSYFLNEPNYTTSCKSLALKYGKTPSHFNGKITNFSKWVQAKLNRFRLQDVDGSDLYWCITMQKGWKAKDGFQWQMRKELADALQLYFKEHKKNTEIQIKDNTKMAKEELYDEIKNLLEANYNLVLTGAPGTGKTYMACEVARKMGAEIKFVQFHPSYDYTDFVEGLRPTDSIDGQIGFERKDGIFKDFCREAITNLKDSKKNISEIKNEVSWKDKLDEFVSESIETEAVYKLRTGKEFTIVNAKDNSLEAYNKTNEKTTRILMKRDEILTLLINKVKLDKVRDVTKSLNRKTGFQEDSYIYAIVKALREQKKKVAVSNVQKVNEKPFVLIIDEINRGDASKIFGELFYAIDPGYRGKTENLVQTQYQNLVSDTDIFAKGFYVPENVYILATMNDIDRSVECMDFAMRRRFVWKEITPSDTAYMLDELEKSEEAKVKMEALNAEIAKTEGLGGAYQIGPAYFKKLEKNGNDFDKLWTMNIEPLLKEYLRGFRDAEKLLNGFKAAYYGENESKEVME